MTDTPEVTGRDSYIIAKHFMSSFGLSNRNR
jgi:hypothetical protein